MASLRILIGLFMLAVPAAAQEPNAATTASAAQVAINAALRWIAANSTYEPIAVRHWVPLKAEDMAANAWMLHVAADPQMVFSMYSCARRTLYFRADADFNDAVVFSFLVHELTHHLQCETGRSEVDLCGWERQAYGLQGAYLQSVIKAGAKDGRRLSRAEMSAAQATEADLDRRRDAACADLRRR